MLPKTTLAETQPTYRDLEVDGFVTNLPVDHGRFQEGSEEEELLHLPSAVLQGKSQGSGFRPARGMLSAGKRGAWPLSASQGVSEDEVPPPMGSEGHPGVSPSA